MTDHEWVKEAPFVVTVCDTEGIVLAMNDRSIDLFEDDGGTDLIGTNLLECHGSSRIKLEGMLKTQEKNTYTFEEDGKKYLSHQFAWHKDGQYAGFVEIIIEVPEIIPHRAG